MSDNTDMGIPPYEPERDRELQATQEPTDMSEQATLAAFAGPDNAWANSIEQQTETASTETDTDDRAE